MSAKTKLNLRQTLRANAGQVYRIAITLCGNAATAEKITRRVLRKSLSQARTWDTDQDAARWFARFTVLCTRSCRQPNPRRDPLLTVATDPEMADLIHALRGLPMQQREAFVLHHGECFDLRQMSTAMDCSSSAASTHLTAATQTLRSLSPAGLGPLTLNFPRMLHQISAPPDRLEILITRAIGNQRFRRFIRFGIAWPLIILGMVVLGCIGYQIWKMILV